MVLAIGVRRRLRHQGAVGSVEAHRHCDDRNFTGVLDTVAVGVDPHPVADLQRRAVADHLEVAESVGLPEQVRVAVPGLLDGERTGRHPGAVEATEALREVAAGVGVVHRGDDRVVGRVDDGRTERQLAVHLLRGHDGAEDVVLVVELAGAGTLAVLGVLRATCASFEHPRATDAAGLQEITRRDRAGERVAVRQVDVVALHVAVAVTEPENQVVVAVDRDVRQHRLRRRGEVVAAFERWGPRVPRHEVGRTDIARVVAHGVVADRADVRVGAAAGVVQGELERRCGRERAGGEGVDVAADGRRAAERRRRRHGGVATAHATDVHDPVLHAEAGRVGVAGDRARVRDGDAGIGDAGHRAAGTREGDRVEPTVVDVDGVERVAVLRQVDVADAFTTDPVVHRVVVVVAVGCVVRGERAGQHDQCRGRAVGRRLVDGIHRASGSVLGVTLHRRAGEDGAVAPGGEAVHRAGLALGRDVGTGRERLVDLGDRTVREVVALALARGHQGVGGAVALGVGDAEVDVRRVDGGEDRVPARVGTYRAGGEVRLGRRYRELDAQRRGRSIGDGQRVGAVGAAGGRADERAGGVVGVDDDAGLARGRHTHGPVLVVVPEDPTAHRP